MSMKSYSPSRRLQPSFRRELREKSIDCVHARIARWHFLPVARKNYATLLHRANAGALRNAYRAAGTARDIAIAIALAVAVNSMMPRHEQNGHAGEREHLTSPGHRL
jgi:hypothetical protein